MEMEEEAREAGLGRWFNGEDQGGVLVESWSGPNSEASASQDQVCTTELTTIHWGQGVNYPVGPC